MQRIDRKTFLKGLGGAALGASLARAARTWASETPADLILKNGILTTMEDQQPTAQAMAVHNGRIQAVGSEEAMQPFLSPTTKVIDLNGKCVSPGIIDAHSHVVGFGQMNLKFVVVRPPRVNGFETLRQELAKAARQKPAGEWIVARGFDTFKEGRFPRRWELDEAVPNHPVLAIHWSGQYGIANTLALKKANLLRSDVQDPYGGKYLRDRRNGLPDGTLLHYPAIYSVYQPTLDERERVECAAWGMRQFASVGVTCVHDNFCHPQYASAYVRLERMGQLPCRVRVYPYVQNLQACQMFLERTRRFESPMVRLQGVKLAVDGYAMMYNVPPEQRHLAIPMHPQPLFNQIIKAIHDAGLQADVHAVGDKGVDWTLEAFAAASGSATACAKRRHRIEHFPFRKLDSIRRAAEMGVPVCTQPTYIAVKADDFRQKLGAGATTTMLPLKTFAAEGVHVALGADVPAFPAHSPLESIRSAMDRMTGRGQTLDRSEAVSFLEALRMHTLGSACAAFDEDELGSLKAGKCADFVIWNGDLRKVRTGAEAAALRPLATYVAGKAVFEA